MACKQSLLSYRIAPNGNRKRVGSIQQHFCFHCTAKRDGSLRKGPKSDPIWWKHSINIIRVHVKWLISYTIQLSVQHKFKKENIKKAKDTCSKTVFTPNKKLYQKIDDVSIGSCLGPLLANIIMTELERKVIKQFIDDKTLSFIVVMLMRL